MKEAFAAFVILVCHAAVGDYQILIDFQSYSNPSGRCAQCSGSTDTDPGCCDTPFPVPPAQNCPAPNTCDTGLQYCLRGVGSTGICPNNEQISAPQHFTNENFVTTFFGLDDNTGLNHTVFNGTGSWQGVQVLFIFRECALGESCIVLDPNEFIDTIPLDIRTEVGVPISQITLTGTANIASITISSFEVICAPNFYGPDCTIFCPDFESCAGCGLPGFTGEYCQLTGAQNCDAVQCNGNGVCRIGMNYVCLCNAGFRGNRCEIANCEGVDCILGACLSSGENSTCACNSGLTTGRQCDTLVRCGGIDCRNGVCVEDSDGFRCDCEASYNCTTTDSHTSTSSNDETTPPVENSSAALIGGMVGGLLGTLLVSAILTASLIALCWYLRKKKIKLEETMRMMQNEAYEPGLQVSTSIAQQKQENELAKKDVVCEQEMTMTENEAYAVPSVAKEAQETEPSHEYEYIHS